MARGSQASCRAHIYRKNPTKLLARFPKVRCPAPPPAASAFCAVWKVNDLVKVPLQASVRHASAAPGEATAVPRR